MEVIEQVIERFPAEGDRQRAQARDIPLRIFARPVGLGEHDLALGPVQDPPAPDPMLERAELAVSQYLIGPSPQGLEDRRRLEARGPDQQCIDLRPDGREGVWACAIRAGHCALAGERARPIPPGRVLAPPDSDRCGLRVVCLRPVPSSVSSLAGR